MNYRTIRTTIITLLILSLSAIAVAADETTHKIDQYMQAWLEARQFNGVVLIAKDGEVVFDKGYGLANMSWGMPNTSRTAVDIGSISKQFTAVLVFQLCQDGALSLADPLTKYYPELDPALYGGITINHMLQQMSGIPCYLNDQEMLAGGYESTCVISHHYTVSEMNANIFSKPPHFPPGQSYRYSNSNYYLLYQIIEKVTGKTYSQVLKERIVKPLGLENTGLIRYEVPVPKMATGYQVIGDEYGIAPYEYDPNTYGAGSIYSTARDLLAWNIGLRDGSLLNEEWQTKLFTPYLSQGGTEYAYSQTQYHVPLPGFDGPVDFWSFNGAPAGFMSDVYMFPHTGHIVVLLDNTQEYHHWQIGPGLFSILNGQDARMPLPSAGDAITAYVMKHSVAQALEEYKRLSALTSEYEFSAVEREINTYGYRLMNQGRMELAERVFELNKALYPFSANVMDSLGDYYVRMEDMPKADEYFARKSAIREKSARLVSLLKEGEFNTLIEEINALRKNYSSASLFKNHVIGPIFGRAMGENPEKAVSIAEIWALANPEAAGPLFSLAAASTRAGNAERAEIALKEIIRRFPGTRFENMAQDRLSALTQDK